MSSSGDNAGPRRRIFDGGFLVLVVVTLVGGVLVALKHGVEHMLAVAGGAIGFLALLSPKILAGALIAAAIPVLIPRDRISSWIGRESGVQGLGLAALAGAALPGGPSMTFLLVASLLRSGADLGAAFAFITGWALLSLNRTLIWEMSFLPSEVVWLRVALCLPVPILLGLVTRWSLRRWG